MKISNAGIDLIAKWEGFRSKAYLDIVGVWTIGYGHTKGVRAGDTITKTEAKKWLASEIERHVAKFDDYIKVSLTQGQFDALASFHYNLGANILKGTGLLDAINRKDWESAAKQMLLYNKAGGRVIQGLVNRRKEESELFLKSSPKKETPKKETPKKTTPKQVYYTVKKNDNLSKIAKNHKTTLATLLKLNPSKKKNPDLIQVGERIRVE